MHVIKYTFHNQKTPFDIPNVAEASISVGFVKIDLTDSITRGIRSGVAIGFLYEFLGVGLVYSDFYEFLKNFKPRLWLPESKHGLEDAFITVAKGMGLIVKKSVKRFGFLYLQCWDLSAIGEKIIKDIEN